MSTTPSLGAAAAAAAVDTETFESTLDDELSQDQIKSEDLLSPIEKSFQEQLEGENHLTPIDSELYEGEIESLLSPIVQIDESISNSIKCVDPRESKRQRNREYRARMQKNINFREKERRRKQKYRERKKAEALAKLQGMPEFKVNQTLVEQRAANAQRQREYRARIDPTPHARAMSRERKRLWKAKKGAEAEAWAKMDYDHDDDTDTSEMNVSSSDFDPSLSEDERRFYLKAYPNIEMVRDRKVHCTTCKIHIGTAPSQESSIKMHPVLRVTHCNKCHDFYNSGEFSKGEDGSELYCRWCGQGGEVYCCSNCPYVFCKSCIVKNLSRGVVADIEQNENWSCFNCAPKILWPLRAQHWALIKYIEKQKKALANLPEAEMKIQMTKDRSTCCRLAKAKAGSMSDSLESIDSLSRRSREGSVSKKSHKLSPSGHSPAAKRAKPNDEVVCTPDLLSMLEPDCQITVSAKPRPSQSPMATSPKVMSIQNPKVNYAPMNKNPPPLVLRNTSVQVRPVTSTPIVRRTVIGPRTPTPGGGNVPVYHTINGYRIDLNSAAQQETFRLPNGKLIQVKRQGAGQLPGSSPMTPAAAQPPTAWQRQIQQSRPVQISQMHSTPQQQYPQITIQQHTPQHHPQMLRYQSTISNSNVSTMHNGSSAQIQVINGAAQQAPQVAAQPVAAPQQVATAPLAVRPIMVRHVFPDTAIGQARTQLQDQVFNAMEICQHLTGKVHTLTNSNAYKQARNYLEVKELYIHLSYLLTYAIGRFKGLQDKCLGDMRQLGFVTDADSLENGQLAAGVDFVRYGQLDDVELFNTGCNSFHNQVYEYRKSLHANLENDPAGGGEERPLSPLRPLGTCFIDADSEKAIDKRTVPKVEIPDIDEESMHSGNNGQDDDIDDDTEMQHTGHDDLDDDEAESLFTPITSMYEDENAGEYNADYDGTENYDDDYDMTRPGGGHSGGDAVIRRENESHANDRKLTRLIEKYPSIWCTRHPDYGNFEITRKQWNRIQAQFSHNENIKLRWKNIRKRFVRIEERLKVGKRFNGYYDRSINFLFNRNLPEHEWMPVDRGDHFGSGFGRQAPASPANDYNTSEQYNNDFVDDSENVGGGGSSFRSCPVRVIDIRPTDMKIINFVKCNPVLWRKSPDPATNKVDERTRKSLWMHLWKQLPAMSCEELIDRWAYLYEMYKTFRLKNIKDETTLGNLEVKYSKYLATLHFLYKIDEEDLRKENLAMQDLGNLDNLPDNDLYLQDMPDDREFVLALVEAVKPCVNLWHPRHIDYNDTARREQMWQEIEEKLKDFKHKQASDDEDNEIEIVEPKTDTITLIDSDNEDDVSSKSPAKNASTTSSSGQMNTKTSNSTEPTSNGAINEEIDFMATAQSFLASMLEVDLNESDQPYTLPSPSSNDTAAHKKQPRKKTTNKPNPTLLKQKEMLERERLEEMKRNDLKLKMKCTIELKKAEEEFPFAKSMLDEKGMADAESKKDEDCEEVEVLLVEDLDSSAEEEKLKVVEKSYPSSGSEGAAKKSDIDMNEDEKEKENEDSEYKNEEEIKENENKDNEGKKDADEKKIEKEEEKKKLDESERKDKKDEKEKKDEDNNDEKEDKNNDLEKNKAAFKEQKKEIEVKKGQVEDNLDCEKIIENVNQKPKVVESNKIEKMDVTEADEHQELKQSKDSSEIKDQYKIVDEPKQDDKIRVKAEISSAVSGQSSNPLSEKKTCHESKKSETTADKDDVDIDKDIEMIQLNQNDSVNEKTLEGTNETSKDVSLEKKFNKEEKDNTEMTDSNKVVNSAEKIIEFESVKSENEKMLESNSAQITNNKGDATEVVSETTESINGETEIDVDKEIEKLLQKERSDNANFEATTTEKSLTVENIESSAPSTTSADVSSEDLMNDITELIENATNILT